MSDKPYVGPKRYIGATAIESQQRVVSLIVYQNAESYTKNQLDVRSAILKSSRNEGFSRVVDRIDRNSDIFTMFLSSLSYPGLGIIEARPIICRVNINSRSRG